MKVLITGGAGFIGSHLAERLLDEGHEVTVLDDLSSGKRGNLNNCQGYSSFEFFEGDVRNPTDVEKAIEGSDYVLHEAAITSVPASLENPDLTKEINIGGTENVLEKSLSEGIKRFIFASSCAVYGDPAELPLKEDTKKKPSSPYAESKLEGEKLCEKYGGEGLETVSLRYFNVYGPRQGSDRYAGVISKFLEKLDREEAPVIYGDGEQTRNFVYVNDVVKANFLALEKGKATGDVFNIGSGKAITINELCEKLLKVTENQEVNPLHEDPRPGDIRHSEAEISKASEILGYKPEVDLEEGLKRIVEKREDKNPAPNY